MSDDGELPWNHLAVDGIGNLKSVWTTDNESKIDTIVDAITVDLIDFHSLQNR